MPFGGYRRAPIEQLLLEIADSFEDVWRERADLADRVEQLEDDLVRYRELETLLRQTLVSAERTAAELRDGAQKQAELVVEEAHAAAREIMRAARAERERLAADSARIRAQLDGSARRPRRGAIRPPKRPRTRARLRPWQPVSRLRVSRARKRAPSSAGTARPGRCGSPRRRRTAGRTTP